MNFVSYFAVKILKIDEFRDFENFDLLNYIFIYFPLKQFPFKTYIF